MLTEEEINRNYLIFQHQLNEAGVFIDDFISEYGEKIKNGTFLSNEETGMAYKGSLLSVSIEILKMAYKINKVLPESVAANPISLTKVCLLQNVAKATMFTATNDEWKKKRGMLYDFTKYDYALKTGMRSLCMCMKHKILFNDEETEAFVVIDKEDSDYSSKMPCGMLSTIVKSAKDIIMSKNRIMYKNNNNK